jgi:hypothetical protein
VHLVPQKERWELLSANKVWPHDADQQAAIDVLKAHISKSWLTFDSAVIDKIEGLNFDAFMSFCDALNRNFPTIAIEFLKAVAEAATDSGVAYNAIDMLRESENGFSLHDELQITRQFDSGTLFELYHDMVNGEFGSRRTWVRHLEHKFEGDVSINDVEIHQLDL